MKTSTFISTVFFFTSLLHANAQNPWSEVTFTEALTNTTQWVYHQTKFISGEMQIGSREAYIASPDFGFAITSILITARKASDNTSRNVKIAPISDANLENIDVTPTSANYALSEAKLPAEEQIRTFKIINTDGRGNIYIKSAIISGVPLLDTPQNLLSSEIYRDRFTASWTPDAAATTHKIEVTKKIETPFTAQYTANYNLSALQNSTGNSKDITDSIGTYLPGFDGQALYIPKHTSGTIQIGASGKTAFLILPPQESYESLKLVIRAKHCDDSKTKEMTVRYILNAETTDIGTITFSSTYEIHVLELKNDSGAIPAGAKVALYSPNTTENRFQIDLLGFATETKDTETTTELVISKMLDASHYTAKTLTPDTKYFWSVISYGEGGAVSKRSEWQSVNTNNLRPPAGFYISMR